jgi:spore germination protein KC
MKRLVSFALIILIIIILIIFPLAGCTSYKELKDLSIVEATGFDSAGSNSFKLTFQIFNPKSGGGGGTVKKSSGEATETIVQGTGNGIYDAIRNATLTIGRKLYFSNTRIYLVGEDICKNNFDKLIDFLERPTSIRPNVNLCVVKGTTMEVLTAKKNDQIISAQTIQEIIESYGTSSKILNTELENIFEAESTGVTDIALPAIKVARDDQGNDIITMDGTAVFKKNILAGYLDLNETRGALWIMGKVKSGIIVTKPSNGGSVSMEIISANSKIDLITKDNKPAIKINIDFATDVAEMQTPKDTALSVQYLKQLKALQEEQVKKEMQAAITKVVHEYDSDVFGFGMMIFQNQPDVWRKIRADWNNGLKNISIEVNVTSKIEHSGLITDKTSLKQ